MSNSDRTVTHSIRISERALKAIEEESKRQNVSVNTIINQQLLSFTEFERFFKRLGVMKFSSSTVQHLLEASSNGAVAKAGVETGMHTPHSIILAKHGRQTLETVYDYLEILSEYGNQFEFGKVEQDGKIVITLLHRLGSKGSIFFQNYMKVLFEQIDYAPKIDIKDDSVVIELVSKRSASSD